MVFGVTDGLIILHYFTASARVGSSSLKMQLRNCSRQLCNRPQRFTLRLSNLKMLTGNCGPQEGDDFCSVLMLKVQHPSR